MKRMLVLVVLLASLPASAFAQGGKKHRFNPMKLLGLYGQVRDLTQSGDDKPELTADEKKKLAQIQLDREAEKADRKAIIAAARARAARQRAQQSGQSASTR